MPKYRIVSHSKQIGSYVFCRFTVEQRQLLFFWCVWRHPLGSAIMYFNSEQEALDAIEEDIADNNISRKVTKCL